LEGQSPDLRSNIQAVAHFFKGVEMVSFDAAQSSPGVVLLNASDPSNPVFSLPDMGPAGTTSVQIWCAIRANCGYVDTLAQNDQIQVFDTWTFTYDLGNQTGLSETDATPEYRDAFAVPFFTLDITNDHPPAQVGECFTRELKVNNSALDGFVSSLTYTNEQGAGIWVRSVTANGIPLILTKNIQPSGDTLLFTTLGGAEFSANMPGDGDVFFDPDEALTIVEEICVVDCNMFRGSTHKIGWGCDGEVCVETTGADFVETGEGAPHVDVKTFGSLPNDFAGYCKTGQTTVTFTNDGIEIDPGFATMFDLEAGIGLGGLFNLNDNGFTITGIRVAGVDLPGFAAFNRLEDFPQFMADPDGIGGLSDEDGDGFFDDLAVNRSFEVTAFYAFDCSNATQTDPNSNCTNDFATRFSARVDYTDACGERLVRLQNNFFRPANTNSSFSITGDADAFVEQDTFIVELDQTRSVRFFEHECNGDEFFEVKVVLPAGISLVPGRTELIKNSIIAVPLLSNTVQNDTLTLIYDASFSPFLNGSYKLRLALRGDCSAALGPTVFPTIFSFECPPCGCRHVWFCGDMEGPRLHATSPPCPPDVFNCPQGIQTTRFEVERTTFGFEDPFFQVPFDPDLANKKVAISCDSVEMRILNVVGEAPVSDSIGVVISYQNPDMTDSPDPVFLFGGGEVRLTHAGEVFVCQVDISDLTTTVDTSQKTLRFDLGHCLTDFGLTLTTGDSIAFRGQFALNPEGPYGSQFAEVPEFRAYGYAIVDGEEMFCDNFGETFTVAKNRIAFDFPNSQDFPEGCETATLQYRLIIVNNGFEEFFGDELRPASRVDSLVFDFDPQILTAFDETAVDVSIPGHPVFGDGFFDLPPLSDFPDGHYAARFDTLISVPTLNKVQTYTFNLRIHLVPNCRAVSGSADGTNLYDLDARIFYRDRYYAKFIGDGSCMMPVTDSVHTMVSYDNPPTFSLTPLSSTNFIFEGDTATWTLQFCNTSFVSDAGFTWLALEDSSGTVQVVAVEDVTDAANPVALSVQDYGMSGTNSVVFTGPLLAANATNDLSEICRIFRVKAVINQCVNADLVAKTGWNCQPFANPDWTPLDNPPCEEVTQNLKLTILDPFLEAKVVDQPLQNPDICDTSSITILLRNIDRGAAFDVQTQLILPVQGATLIPGSVEVAYPSGSDFVPALTDPVFVGNTVQGQVFQYDNFQGLNAFLDEEGLAGFNPSNPNDSNEVKIRFAFQTDCDFRSGDLAFYNFKGRKGCGAPTNFEAGESFPLLINGAEPDLTKVFEIAFSGQSFLSSNSTSTLQITVKNLTANPSSNADKISLSLPPGIAYVGGSTLVQMPAGWAPGDPTIDTPGGFQILNWPMPAGLGENETAVFEFQVQSPFIDCATEQFDVELVTTSVNELFCATDNINCNVQTITSTNGAGLTALPVGQKIALATQNLTSACSIAGTENLTGEVLLTALDDIPNENFTLTIFFDQNQNGEPDSADILVHQQQFAIALEAGVPVAVPLDLEVPGSQVCGLIVRLTALNIDLCDGVWMALPPPAIQNAGGTFIECVLPDSAVTLPLGDPECAGFSDYDFTWHAIPPAMTNALSNFKLPNPDLTVTFAGPDADTLLYVLETQRPGCAAPVFDTATVLLTPQIVVNAPPTIILFAGQDTTLGVNISGGVPPFSYAWSPESTLSDPASPNPVASPDADENYSVTVSDSRGCVAVGTVSVQVVAPVTASVVVSDSLLCFGESAQLMAAGGDHFVWLENAGNPTTGNLSAYDQPDVLFSGGQSGGIYQYELVTWLDDFPDFPDTAQVSIFVFENPTIQAGSDQTVCLGEPAPLSASAAGGTGNYTFHWSPDVLFGQGTANPVVLPAATTEYVVTVTDENGCEASDTVLVLVENCGCVTPDIVGVVVAPALCGQSVGGANVQVAGNASDFLFTWNPDVGTPQNGDHQRTNLPFGGYSVTVTRAADPDCFSVVHFIVENEDAPTTQLTATPAACSATTGAALFDPPGYTYVWPDGQTTNARDDLAPGTYFVTFSDPANPDCPNVAAVEIGSENPLSAELNILQLPDCGASNGVVQIDVSGGSGNYNFSWPSPTNTQDGLSSGIYDLTITDTDATMCEVHLTFVLPDNVPPANVTITDTTDVLCFGDLTGAVGFEVTYDPAFSGPADTLISDGLLFFENGQLPAGQFCVVIRDSAGCLAGGACFEIEQNAPLEAYISTTKACAPGGTVSTQITGGTPPFAFDWADLPGTDDPADRADLPAGLYTLQVSDQNGCTALVEVPVLPCDCEDPAVTGIGITEALCGISNGTAKLFLDQNPANLDIQWTPDVGQIISPTERHQLPAGGYTVFISQKDNPTCSTSATFVITNADGPTAGIETQTPATCQLPDGTAVLTPDTLEYEWPDGETGFARTDLAAGIYAVTFSAPNSNCDNVLLVEIEESNTLQIALNVEQYPDCGQSNGEVSLDVSGGTGNYAFGWPGGTNSQSGLSAGTYSVEVTDVESGCSETFVFVLENAASTAEIVLLDTFPAGCFGEATGGILYEVNYGADFEFPADTVLTGGAGVLENGQLPAGQYCLEIRDAAQCVQASACFEIKEPDPISVLFTATPDCGGGALDVTVLGGTPPYTFFWENVPGDPVVEDPANLSAGFYGLAIQDANNCTFALDSLAVDTCVVCSVFPADTVVLVAPACGDSVELCLQIANDDFPNYTISDNGTPYAGPFTHCDFDFFGVYTYATLPGLGQTGPYEVLSWPVGNQNFGGIFQNISDLVDSMNVWDPAGAWALDPNGAPFIIGGVEGVNYAPMEVLVVNSGFVVVLGYSTQFTPKAFAMNLGVGEHEIVTTNLLTGCRDTVFARVVCTQSDTIHLVLEVEASDTLCLPGLELVGPPDSLFNACPDGTFVDYAFTGDSCVVLTGLEPGLETACLVLCDSFNVCDTTFVEITVLPNLAIVDTILVTQIADVCFDWTDLNALEGPIASMENICPQNSGTSVDFVLSDSTFCVSYVGLTPGTDTACVELCDSLGNCDVVEMFITVVPGEMITDTIPVFWDTITYCLDTANLPGNIVAMEDICPDQNGDAVVFALDSVNYCVTYWGINPGTDTACIRLTDDLGNVWLTQFGVTAVQTHSETFCDTIFINMQKKWCLDRSELAGDWESVTEICPDEGTPNVDFFQSINDPACVEYIGREIGRDTACYVICDEFNICDTTFFCVEVVENFDPPRLGDDLTDSTFTNTPVIIDIKANDTIYGHIQEVFILDEPLYGEATIFLDCSAGYTPDDPFCERSDQFTYVVCNEVGCDTATVVVWIDCIELTVFNAVSPNNDGVNDIFYISKIENFDHHVRIFNRWGNLVFESRDYRNNGLNSWPGTFKDEKDLPDGTYFYLLEWIDDNGRRNVQRGIIELMR
ncbi:MAG: gliding motility-associated C-terminal domain-containing protein, partial [Bacteroidetes bacterium]